jgi:hypothetical protein
MSHLWMRHFERTKLSGFTNVLLPISTLPDQPGLLPVLLTLATRELRGRSHAVTEPPARGRHHEFSPDREAEIVEWPAKKAANNTAVNRTELLNECIERFGKSVTRGWIDSFLIRHADE